MEEKHFYEPLKGHGLAYDPLNSIIGPRPIGWISSRGSDGSINLAPYSFFNLFNYVPPIIGFSSIGEKNSLRNARETGEFVWNLVTRKLAGQMNETSAEVPYGWNEFQLGGLTMSASKMVSAPRVAESPVNLECKISEIVQLRGCSAGPVGSWLVLGEVVAVHIAQSALKERQFDTFGLGIVLRAGGPTSYAEISPESRFDMTRPSPSVFRTRQPG